MADFTHTDIKLLELLAKAGQGVEREKIIQELNISQDQLRESLSGLSGLVRNTNSHFFLESLGKRELSRYKGEKHLLDVYDLIAEKSTEQLFFWIEVTYKLDLDPIISHTIKDVLYEKGFLVKADAVDEGDIVKITPKFRTFYLNMHSEHKPSVDMSNNEGVIIHDSLLSESPINHKVTTTPIKNESTMPIAWYKRTIFKYVVWPIVVILFSGLLIFIATKIFNYYT